MRPGGFGYRQWAEGGNPKVMLATGSEILAAYLWLSVATLYVVSTCLLLSGLDDLFFDLWCHARTLYRSATVYRRHPRAAADTLPPMPEQWIAVLVPAWREEDVVHRMLRHLRAGYAYGRYKVFVGVYPNDPATARRVRQVQRDEPMTDGGGTGHWLQLVETRAPGPTRKSDCLNALYRHVQAYERDTGIAFAAFVLHDAEDIVHPLELKLFNRLIPGRDMVQLPVFPLECAVGDLVGGHYMDEFAEAHIKDLAARETLAGAVPCAGVGCAFSRRALAHAASLNPTGPFDDDSLTEDYELALRLAQARFRCIFVVLPRVVGAGGRHMVATREMFPSRLADAVRQKARWLIGIGLQAWRSHGWQGGLAQRYLLLRDRKAIWSAFLNAAAYAVLLNLLLAPPILAAVGADPVLQTLLVINLGFLINRLAHRAWCTGRLYGWRHGLMSAPRGVVGNLVNCLAAGRALKLYLAHRLTGRPLRWDKTRHAFPDQAALRPLHARLGTILVEGGQLSQSRLAAALAEQSGSGRRLGDILVARGWVSPAAIADALGRQRAAGGSPARL